MKRHLHILAAAIIVYCGCLLTFIPAQATSTADSLTPLKPESVQVDTSRDIINVLQRRHYSHETINDTASDKIFQGYIKKLDPSRSYFYQKDIDDFERYRLKIDDTLLGGDLSPAYFIFNRFQQRKLERVDYLQQQLAKGIKKFDFSSAETLQTDRENAPWIKDRKAMDELWRKKLKAEILSLKMAGKEPKKIEELLKKRYENQLNLASQTTSDDIFQIYMNALAQTYDPHTQYFSPRVSENFKINMSLKLEGIGAMLTQEDEYTKVVRLIPAGPAEKSGQLKAADRIVGVGQDNEGDIIDVVGWRLDDVVDLIRGPKGSVVRLEILPANTADIHQTKIVRIERNTVKLEEQAASSEIIEIQHGIKNYRLGIIEIPAFYADFEAIRAGDPDYKSTTRDVKKILEDLSGQNIDGIIIDLRNNGGGSLQEVNTLTGLFINEGPTVQVRYANGWINVLRDPDPQIIYNGPLAVIVNRLSASASEIFAGAIQDYGRGIILGNQTFGKGTVQELVPLDKGQLKTTSAKFYRISGASTQNKGVTPDITFPSLYDKTEIGENTLPEALPWDTIYGARHQEFFAIDKQIESLNLKHSQRIAADPDYLYLTGLLELRKVVREHDTISLNEKERLKEQEDIRARTLKLENTRRKAKGLKPFKTYEEMTAGKAEEDLDSKAEDDFMLTESGHILVDLINQLETAVAQTPAG